jgi:hypothetical protein
MARIINSHLGIPIGKMGDIVFKRRNKKIFSQFAAENYKETTSERVIKNRNLFGEVTVFSNFVNRSPVIKFIWNKRKDMPGKAANLKIYKYNHPTIKYYGISSGCKILPYCLQIYEAAVGLTKDTLTFSFKNHNSKGLIPESYKDFKAPFLFTAIIHMEEPVSEKVKHKQVNIRLEEMLESGELSGGGFTHFTFNTAKNSFEIIKDYNKIIVYPAIISFDEYKQAYKWAECGGLYVKGADRVYVPPPKPEPVQESGVNIDIEFR